MDEVRTSSGYVPDGRQVDDSGLRDRFRGDRGGRRQRRRAGRYDARPDERLLRRPDGKLAERAGGEVVTVDAPWGQPLDPAAVEAAFDEHSPDVFGFVHAETSTGVLQPSVPELTDIAHANDALVIADSVTSLGGVELRVDEWGIDVAYSGPRSDSPAAGARSP